jgi:hypothetical protein
MKRYKATIKIRGAEDQHLYGADLGGLTLRAVEKLTEWKPGFGNLRPERIDVMRSEGRVSGNRSKWTLINFIPYGSIPHDQHKWRRDQAAREKADAEAPKPVSPEELQPKLPTAIRLNSRTVPVTQAELDVKKALLEAEEKHDLTVMELLSILNSASVSIIRSGLRMERHPEDPNKKADEE